MENLYTPGKIRTFTGKYINVLEPSAEDIDIIDIAHALSRMPRFGGHTEQFYSVAQHCIMCSCHALEEYKLEALLHDASEAYLMDLPSPVKKQIGEYFNIENKMMEVISKKFGFNWPLSKHVKDIDRRSLEYEWNTVVLDKYNFSSHTELPHNTYKEAFLKLFEFYNK